jgi:hypothetical protein
VFKFRPSDRSGLLLRNKRTFSFSFRFTAFAHCHCRSRFFSCPLGVPPTRTTDGTVPPPRSSASGYPILRWRLINQPTASFFAPSRNWRQPKPPCRDQQTVRTGWDLRRIASFVERSNPRRRSEFQPPTDRSEHWRVAPRRSLRSVTGNR